MEGTFDIIYMNHPANKLYDWAEEFRGRYKPTKRTVPSVQWMVKTQLEIMGNGKRLTLSSSMLF